MTLAEAKETGRSTLMFLLKTGCARVPEIGYTIYLILNKIVSEVI